VQAIASSRSAAHALVALSPGPVIRAVCTIASSRARAPLISSATNAVSGMFFQYLRGISLSIAPVLSRAGLKIDA